MMEQLKIPFKIKNSWRRGYGCWNCANHGKCHSINRMEDYAKECLFKRLEHELVHEYFYYNHWEAK